MSYRVGPVCEGCGMCLSVCPRGAIRWAPLAAQIPVVVDRLRCDECGTCAISCPRDALGPDGVTEDRDRSAQPDDARAASSALE